MDFCKRCLYAITHPLGLVLDDEGVCSGCRVHEEKNALDWSTRWERLRQLVAPYRVQSGRNYDCIVPVSGAGDSYFIVHLVKERLGLNPLLVNYNRYFNTPLGIRNLANLRIRFNCDILYQNINPLVVRKIVRSSLRQLGSLHWPILAGQSVFPVQTAVRLRIPLIIWGAHQGLEQVGMFSHLHEVEMTRRYRKEHDLMGYEADDLLSVFDTLTEDDIWQYRYPADADLESTGVRGIYLGNFVRWDPSVQHQQMLEQQGYASSICTRSFDTYDHVDCFNYMGLHDQLKLFKHGYSKVTDHASREIRHGRMTRAQGLEMVHRHEQAPVPFSQQLCDWLAMDPRALQFMLDQHRNPAWWTRTAHDHWDFHGWSQQQPDPPGPSANWCPEGFSATHSLMLDAPERYITVGKGWPC